MPLYGLDKELAEKQAGKYDKQRESEVKEWIETVLGEKVFAGKAVFMDALKDGVILARLLNAVVPNACKVQNSTMPFKQMENINSFLLGEEKLGVPKADQFQTIDLYEKKNPAQVLDSLYAFARHAHKHAPSKVPLLGPKLSDKHEVQFTKEQLEAGKHVPTQQSGFVAAKLANERGATQSGMNYGLGRQVSDTRVGAGDTSTPSQQSGFVAAKIAQERGATQSGVIYGLGRQVSDSRVGTGDVSTPSQQSGLTAAELAKQRGATQSGMTFGAKREIGGEDKLKKHSASNTSLNEESAKSVRT